MSFRWIFLHNVCIYLYNFLVNYGIIFIAEVYAFDRD
jgi:hypothetical protein